MDLIVLEKKEWDEVKNALIEIKQALEKQGKLTIPKKYLTTAETAEYLNVKPRTIYSYVSNHILNPKNIGGTLRFDRDELESL